MRTGCLFEAAAFAAGPATYVVGKVIENLSAPFIEQAAGEGATRASSVGYGIDKAQLIGMGVGGIFAFGVGAIAGNAKAIVNLFKQGANAARQAIPNLASTAERIGGGLKMLGPGWRVLAPAGEGAATGVLPNGCRTVSRWMSPKEAAAWMAEGGTGIPRIEGANHMFVTELGAAKPGGTGPVRVDFALPESALQKAGKSEWFQIFQPSPSRPVYNVQVHVPEGVKIPGY